MVVEATEGSVGKGYYFCSENVYGGSVMTTNDDKLQEALALFDIEFFGESRDLTEDESMLVHEKKEAIWIAVHDLVDAMLSGLPEKIDSEVRDRLTDEFRFWKRN